MVSEELERRLEEQTKQVLEHRQAIQEIKKKKAMVVDHQREADTRLLQLAR